MSVSDSFNISKLKEGECQEDRGSHQVLERSICVYLNAVFIRLSKALICVCKLCACVELPPTSSHKKRKRKKKKKKPV